MYNASPDEKSTPGNTTLKAVTNKDGVTIGTEIGRPDIVQTRKIVDGKGTHFRNSVSATPYGNILPQKIEAVEVGSG